MDRLTRYIKDIRQAQFFDIQNVSDYFWQNKTEYSDLVTMNLAPPFPFFATRYTMPEKIYSKERGWTDCETPGTEILTVFRALEKPLPGIKMKWFYDIMLFAADGRRINPLARYTAGVDELGRIAKQPDGQSAFWLTSLPGGDPIPNAMVSFLHVSGLALTFLHCKNVEILPAYPEGRKERKARKRKFEIKWRRIKVNAVGQKREAKPGPGTKTGISQSLHIVHGMFRYYGPAEIHGHEDGRDRGLLFGKHAGRFWVASHYRGDPEAGIIEKDYEINPPNEN